MRGVDGWTSTTCCRRDEARPAVREGVWERDGGDDVLVDADGRGEEVWRGGMVVPEIIAGGRRDGPGVAFDGV